MSADTGPSQSKGVGDSANQKIHAIASRHIACDTHSLPCIAFKSVSTKDIMKNELHACKI